MARALSQSGRLDLPSASRAVHMAHCKGGPAAWDPLPNGFDHGSGPTIRSAMGKVSERDDDMAFVMAAARGQADQVAELLPRVSSPSAVVRSSPLSRMRAGQRSAPTTALHAAAASGSEEVVRVLLDGGADPRRRRNGLRVLTPLHEAANVAIAELLLASGAQPFAADPREPDPAWYHTQRGRSEVAGVIVAAARAARSSVPSAGARAGEARRPAVPCLTSAEVLAARRAWSTTGLAVSEFSGAASRSDSGELECAICLTALLPEDACLSLPCRGGADISRRLFPAQASQRRSKSVSPAMRSTSDAEEAVEAGSLCPHTFHTSCIERWWLRSCQCPTCRRDVRQWLPAPDAPSAVSAVHERSAAVDHDRRALLRNDSFLQQRVQQVRKQPLSSVGRRPAPAAADMLVVGSSPSALLRGPQANRHSTGFIFPPNAPL